MAINEGREVSLHAQATVALADPGAQRRVDKAGGQSGADGRVGIVERHDLELVREKLKSFHPARDMVVLQPDHPNTQRNLTRVPRHGRAITPGVPASRSICRAASRYFSRTSRVGGRLRLDAWPTSSIHSLSI